MIIIKKKIITSFVLLSIILLTGCSKFSNVDGFHLMRLEDFHEDFENPSRYSVSLKDNKDKVFVYTPDIGEKVSEMKEQKYDLEEVKVTDEEIVIIIEGKEHYFTRLSSSIVEDKNNIQYEYVIEKE